MPSALPSTKSDARASMRTRTELEEMSVPKVKTSGDRRKAAKAAAEARSDLNVFHSVIVLMENGMLSCPASYAAAQKIIKICKAEAGRRLTDYERAIDAAASD